MRVLVLNSTKGIRSGEVVKCRELRGVLGALSGYQCIEGKHMGKTILPIDGVPEIEVVEPETNKEVLPRATADAIDHIKSGGISSIYEIGRLFCSSGNSVAAKGRDELKRICGTEDHRDRLMKALVNGYTVEEPPTVEDKLRERFRRDFDTWDNDGGSWDAVPLIELLIQSTREVLAEHRE